MSALSEVSLWVAMALTLAARGHDMEQRAATDATAGAVVAGAVVDKVSKWGLPLGARPRRAPKPGTWRLETGARVRSRS
jgi:osmotically inducible lipoprotein OsmB